MNESVPEQAHQLNPVLPAALYLNQPCTPSYFIDPYSQLLSVSPGHPPTIIAPPLAHTSSPHARWSFSLDPLARPSPARPVFDVVAS